MKRWDETLRRLPAGPCSAAEVGVWQGRMSIQLLAGHAQLRLLLVDLWAPGTDNPSWLQSGSVMAQRPAAVVEAAYQGILALAGQHAPRITVLRQASAAAAGEVADASLDLVFIDADHSQQAVLADIVAWRPKVKKNGWLGGHDYASLRFPGVKSAVHQVFEARLVETGTDKTWWVRQ